MHQPIQDSTTLTPSSPSSSEESLEKLMADSTENPNGTLLDNDDGYSHKTGPGYDGDGITLFGVLNRLITAIFFPTSDSAHASAPFLYRIKSSLSENVPLLPQASRNTSRLVLLWARSGSPFRALLVVSVGTILALALTGLLVFMLFLVAATINAVVISLLMSLAAAGGFLAIFFACLTAIYIGALSVAVFVISATTICAVVAALVATGWVGFFCAVWLATRKGLGLAKKSVSMTGSVVSAYSFAKHTRRHHED